MRFEKIGMRKISFETKIDFLGWPTNIWCLPPFFLCCVRDLVLVRVKVFGVCLLLVEESVRNYAKMNA
jgi:hypothetical protein